MCDWLQVTWATILDEHFHYLGKLERQRAKEVAKT